MRREPDWLPPPYCWESGGIESRRDLRFSLQPDHADFLLHAGRFKVTRKLTLNLGLRYELYITPADRWDNQSNFDLVSGQMLLANRGGNSRALITTDKNNWAPRLGFAYALQPRTAIRGGYGISYYPDKFGASGGTLNNNYPFISLQQIIPADRFKPDPTLSIDKGIAVPVQPVLTAASVPLVGFCDVFRYELQDGLHPILECHNSAPVHPERVVQTAYVGTKGTHLFGNNHVNLNQPDPGPGAVANHRPYFCAGSACRDGKSARFQPVVHLSSAPDEMQKGTANGLWLLATYTWAKALDDAASSYNPKNWEGVVGGPADTDFRHNVTASVVYELPVGKGRKSGSGMNSVMDAIVGGWQVNGINTFRTGLPSTATLSPASRLPR